MRVSTLLGSIAIVSALGCLIAVGGAAIGCASTNAAGSYFDDAGGPDPHLSAGDGGPCTNLECQRVTCSLGVTTTVTGVVVNGSRTNPDPIYNAIVYVPNSKVEPFAVGASCDRCGTPASGDPISVALSGADGRFTLGNVPVGDNIPVVIQLGKWRRQITVPHVEACQATDLSRELTRMPRNQREGDIPQMAIATGLVDPIECVLRKMGVDDEEFTDPSGNGRVHMYYSNGVLLPDGSPTAEKLWESKDSLARYDVVLLPCEGDEIRKSDTAMNALIDYTSIGGRVMTSHFGYVWIAQAPPPFPSTADWFYDHGTPGGPTTASVDQTSPKGEALAAWLEHIGASPSFGSVDINESRNDVGMPRNGSTGWLYRGASGTSSALHLSFNTPVGQTLDNQCGRVVFSDFHVAAFATQPGAIFPSECTSGEMTASERVLEFMLYDLATCVQDESKKPAPPPIR